MAPTAEHTRRLARKDYPLPEPEQPFVCQRCGAVSYNPNDIAQGYCGRCHDWTDDDPTGEYDLAAEDPDDDQWWQATR